MRGFPGLLHIPVVSQLFAANEREVDQTDIIMLLTPRIVRTQELTQQDLNPIYIGTANYPALGGTPPLIQIEPTPDATPAPAGAAPVAPGAAPGAGFSIAPPGSGPIPGTTTLPAPPPPAAPALAVPAPVAAPQNPAPAVAPQPSATPTVQPLPAAAGGQVLLSVPAVDFRAGAGPYTVPISITGASRLSTVSLTVTYNPAVLRVRTVQEGSFMRTGGTSATLTQQADPAGGRIDIAILRTADTTGVAGTGVLAALIFDAIAPGPGGLMITGTGTAPGGAPLQLQFGTPPAVTVR